VLVFFALSGISSPPIDFGIRCHRGISIRKFYERRAFRILPAALVYLAVLSVWQARV